MYASSVADLGRFYVPEYVKENFVPTVRYIPEPPAPIRGAMNPWQQERQRVLWMAEEKAWAKIQVLQREWTQLESRLADLIVQYNNAVSAIDARMESLTGKKSPLKKMQGYTNYMSFMAVFAPGFGGIPLILTLVDFLKKGIEQIFGVTARKKKDIENWTRELERVHAAILATQQRMEAVINEVNNLVNIAQTVASQQQVQAQADVEKSEALYAQRQAKEVERGKVRQMVYRQIQMIPRQQGVPDVL